MTIKDFIVRSLILMVNARYENWEHN